MGCSERNFEIGAAGFFEGHFEGDVEGGFVERMAVLPEEVVQCGAVGEEQEQTCKVGLPQLRVVCLSYLEGAGAGVAKSGKKVRGESSEPNPMARLKDWGWAVVEVANRRRLVFNGVLALMVGELLPQKLEGLKCHSLACLHAQFRPV